MAGKLIYLSVLVIIAGVINIALVTTNASLTTRAQIYYANY